jgi:hypothetical protein
MLLSYIDVLVVNDKHDTFNISKPKGLANSADVYALLIDRWIMREANRIDINRRVKFVEDMYAFSTNLALDMFLNRLQRKGLNIEAEEIVPFASKFSINLSELELKGKSLLNRDAFGKFKFAHKSILEFLVAKHAANNPMFAQGIVEFNGLDDFDQAAKFYAELSF